MDCEKWALLRMNPGGWIREDEIQVCISDASKKKKKGSKLLNLRQLFISNNITDESITMNQ